MNFTFPFSVLCLFWIGIGVFVFILLQFITAPFGRHSRNGWGFMVNNKWGWVVMELPSLFIMFYFLLFGERSFQGYVWILYVLWIAHYLNRALIFPFRIKPTQKKMPLIIVISAIFFNIVNAGLNGYYLSELAPLENYGADWLVSMHFTIGILFFVAGMAINNKSDQILMNLRKNGDESYHIPRGFLFNYVSCPNLLGEIIEWTGFAVMAWNLPALSFALWTFANLLPRAMNHHRWYIEKFPAYPMERKALFPFLL